MSPEEPVFDYVPFGGFLESLTHDSLQPALQEAVTNGESPFEIFDLLKEEQVKQARKDPNYAEYLHDLYRDAGVNLISPTMMSHSLQISKAPYREQIRQDLARWQARFDTLDWMEKVTTPSEARKVTESDTVGVVLNTQNIADAIESDLSEINRLYNFGIRIAQLTYNKQNAVGTGCFDRSDGGLSQHGLDVVAELNEMGMVVDLSHCGRQTTLDAVSESSAPVAYTHTFCQSIASESATPRGKSDAELEALRDSDGYIGIMGMPSHYAPDETADEAFETFFDHVDRAVELVGVNRVGIGTDWGVTRSAVAPDAIRDGYLEYIADNRMGNGPTAKLLDGFGPFERYRDWNVIPERLAERGYTDEEINGIAGGNFITFWERALA